MLSGCAPVEAMPAPIPTPTASYISTYETPAPTALAPLTGVEVLAGSVTNSSLAAKIDNHPGARPQVGLGRTDIVYEELVEGGATRYVGIWQSDIPAEIGPVRSIRPMDPDIVSPFGGIIAYSGGQQRFVAFDAKHQRLQRDPRSVGHRGRHVSHQDQGRASQRARQGA